MVKERKAMPKPKSEGVERPRLSKFIKRAPKHEKTKKEKNTYQFVGFFDRLKKIDVKASHASLIDTDFVMDNLQVENPDDLSQSNFISLLNSEKVDNATLEFKRVFRELEHLAYSFPLVILNQKKIIQKLLFQLQNDTLKVVFPSIIELLIALIKDLRADIYQEFLHSILPVIIQILDCSNLQLLDSVFSMLSFSFKYLLKSIKEDLQQFYSVYVELLLHQSKFVRKFAAQSFSYVLRKVPFTPEVVKMICTVQNENEVLAAFDLIFEVCSGDSDQLHSKAIEALRSILEYDHCRNTAEGRRLVRYLYLKLNNTVDTYKQLPIFEVLTETLNETCVSLMVAVINDVVKLKFSKRVSADLCQHFLRTLQKLMVKECAQEDSSLIAESLSILFYFKFHICREIKLFTQQVYKLTDESVFAYFKIMLLKANQITTDSDINVSKILDIKQSNTTVEFNVDSHYEKLQHLIPSLNKWALQSLETRIMLLLAIIQNCGKPFLIEIGGKCVAQLEQLIHQANDAKLLYLVSKFVSICAQNSRYVTLIKEKLKNQVVIGMQYNLILQQHEVLNSYPQFDSNHMLKVCFSLIESYNLGYEDQYNTVSLALISEKVELSLTNCQSLHVLGKILLQDEVFPIQNQTLIFEELCKNLSKNSRQLRIVTLQILNKFEQLNFLAPSDDTQLDVETIKQHYTGKCNILTYLMKAEEYEISMETEKSKANTLRKVQLLLQSGMVPELYLTACYRYAIGCFWVKFQPLYQPAIDILTEILGDKKFVKLHLQIVEQLYYLMQLGGESEVIFKRILQSVSYKAVQSQKGDLVSLIFNRDTVADQDYVQVKDFIYNMTKSLHLNIDYIFSDIGLRNQMMQIYQDFMQYEFAPLNFGRRKTPLEDFHKTVVASNVTESDEFKNARRISFNKLNQLFELFSKSSNLNKLSPAQSQVLIDHYLELIQTADDKLQKMIVQGLIKVSKKLDFDNKTIKLPKYQKLLEGLCDDTKFSDMIPVIAHGSQIEHDDQQPADEEQKKTKATESIPKLSQDDRLQVLPVIVKLLFSKLLKKKGQLNKKSLQQRRNIIYQFLSGLDPTTEFPIFFKEVLEPLGLTLTDTDFEHLRQKLILVSFSQFIQFIGSVEVIFNQLGTLLNRDQFLVQMTNILVLMLSQAKRFLGNLREAESQEEGLYQYVQRQCRMCIRKGLKIVKQLYQKFNYLTGYIQYLSKIFYGELVSDQLSYFKERYISDKSQLIEILTTSWSAFSQENYVKYPGVLPALMSMLKVGVKIEPQVFQLHLAMLKNLVISSIDNDAERLSLISKSKHAQESDEQSSNSEMEDGSEQEEEVKYSQIAKQVISSNIQIIGESLHIFWSTHQSKLKQSLVGKKRAVQSQSFSIQSKTQIKESIMFTSAVRELTFIMSELSAYIIDQSQPTLENSSNQSFLEMMVGLVSQKQLLEATSNFQQKSRAEELLMFGCHAIVKLLNQSSDVKVLDKIYQMFLRMESKKARQILAQGIHKVYGSVTSAILVDLNTVKKGMADVDYDYEKVLSGIKLITELSADQLDLQSVSVLFYCTLSLLSHQEYSVRDYALHAVSKLLPYTDERLFKLSETFLFQNLKIARDEMIMRNYLMALRALVVQSQTLNFKCSTQDLVPLLNEEHEDFFVQILSMQLASRLKALRKLQTVEIGPATFSKALLPLVDYLIFDMKSQQENRRNTVRYSRDQSQQLQDESLNVYTAYAKKLSWGHYMTLVRKLLYKIEKATRQQNSVAAQKQDSLTEKTICKCLCKVLDGFNISGVPDALDAIEQTVQEKYHRKPNEVVEYSDFLKEFVGSSILDGEESEEISDNDSDHSDDEDFHIKKAKPDAVMICDNVEDIQSKFQKKVLPLLQRHILQVKGDNTTIRSFVAVSLAKVIRKLPVKQFTMYLQKLINLIVIKGLRVKDLNTRDKARKALVKVIEEVSPKFMTLILKEMQNNLTRGFQLHVHLYTVHYIFNHMKDQMKVGQVTNQVIQIMSPLLLREMFGDLLEEREASDTQKKHIKESKARKAMPIYEVFAQFIDFKTSFLELIQPIVKVLEDNPNHAAIQQTEDLLARISNSLLKNESVTSGKLLPFLKQIIEKGVNMSLRTKINDEKAKRDYGAKADSEYVMKSKEQQMLETHEVKIKWAKTDKLAGDKKTQEICGRVLANFGLQSLKKALNHKGLILQGNEHDLRDSKQINVNESVVTLMDPFVQPLLDSFKTYYNPIVVQTLQILIHVIHLGLPSFKLLLKKFINRIFKLFDTNNSAENDFINSLFKCTSELIKTYTVYNDLSELQIKTLVMIIKANVTNFSTQSSVFMCLKSILHKRFACADLYDLMTTIQDMMVTSVQQATRSVCAQIFITFILEYPMEEKRLDQHIQHLLKNLTYFDAQGRQQLLETLQTIIDKMPEQKLEQWSDLIFITLFLRLVNESSSRCREIVTEILKRQLTKTKKRYVETVFQMNDSSEAMTNGKLQMLAIMADCGKLQKQDIQKTVEMVTQIIGDSAFKENTKAVSEDEDLELEVGEKSGEFLKNIGLESEDEPEMNDEPNDQWSNAYFSIRCLENIYSKCNQNLVTSTAINQQKNLKQDLLTLMWKSGNYWVRLSSFRVMKQLMVDSGAPKNLVGDENTVLKVCYQVLSVYNFAFVTSQLCEEIVLVLDLLIKHLDESELVKFFKKASYIGRRILGEKSDSQETKLSSIIKLYQSALQSLSKNNSLQSCCGPMLELVYRTYTDEQIATSVKDASTVLVDSMSSILNKDVFIKIFNDTQMLITKSRTDRKIKEKMLVTSEEGQVLLAKKRANKLQKKKLKHKEKVFMNALTR